MAPTDAPADVAAVKPVADAPANVLAAKSAAGTKGKGETRPPPVPYRQLFRYATRLDMALNGFAFVCAVFAGAVFPCFALLFVSGGGRWRALSGHLRAYHSARSPPPPV